MNFDSPEFLVFLPAVVLAYALLAGHLRSRHALLLAASYLFYMSWSWRYAGLIAFSTLIDYGVGLRLARENREGVRRALLVTSLVTNLGLLGLFKYFNFFADSADGLVHALGLDWQLPHHQLLLPVGISFYTFQTLSYTLDLYRRRIEPERDLTRFALFVSFFPQLVAGPIVRASDFLPQLRSDRDATAERVRFGLARIFRGLAKKVLIADLLAALVVDRVFAQPEAFSSVDLALALYAYAFQIYADFSGYSDIAIGAAALLGFRIPENFDRPYLARNVREFWTRWHISLSSWLRDYLYIPLGGNRGPRWRTTRNLLITMGLGGLWHGAAWTFVLWGLYHGLLLILARGSDRRGGEGGPGRVWLERAVCFHLVVGGWLLFRATDLEHLGRYLGGLGALEGGLTLHPFAVLLLAAAGLAHWTPRAWVDGLQERWTRAPAPLQGAAYAGAIAVFAGATIADTAFIYFQF